MEAEYVACFLATQEAIRLRSFLHDLNLTNRIDDPVELMCSNTTAIQFTRDPKFHRRIFLLMLRLSKVSLLYLFITPLSFSFFLVCGEKEGRRP